MICEQCGGFITFNKVDTYSGIWCTCYHPTHKAFKEDNVCRCSEYKDDIDKLNYKISRLKAALRFYAMNTPQDDDAYFTETMETLHPTCKRADEVLKETED